MIVINISLVWAWLSHEGQAILDRLSRDNLRLAQIRHKPKSELSRTPTSFYISTLVFLHSSLGFLWVGSNIRFHLIWFRYVWFVWVPPVSQDRIRFTTRTRAGLCWYKCKQRPPPMVTDPRIAWHPFVIIPRHKNGMYSEYWILSQSIWGVLDLVRYRQQ